VTPKGICKGGHLLSHKKKKLRKGKIKYEWVKIRVFTSDIDLETYLRNNEHRNSTKNGPQRQKCIKNIFNA
jgi:hypothetical protein